MDKDRRIEEQQNSQDFRALGLEIVFFFVASMSSSFAFTVSNLAVLTRASRDCDARCKFALSWKFLLVKCCYVPFLLLVCSHLGISVDWIVVSIQIFGFLFLLCLIFGSRAAIAEGVRRISIFIPIVFRAETEAETCYRDFLPDLVTPPPNL